MQRRTFLGALAALPVVAGTSGAPALVHAHAGQSSPIRVVVPDGVRAFPGPDRDDGGRPLVRARFIDVGGGHAAFHDLACPLMEQIGPRRSLCLVVPEGTSWTEGRFIGPVLLEGSMTVPALGDALPERDSWWTREFDDVELVLRGREWWITPRPGSRELEVGDYRYGGVGRPPG